MPNADRSLIRRLMTGGILLGMGIAGFFDGIVLHQLLQWHHMVSNTHRYPATTVAGLKANVIGDGLFHVLAFCLTLAGMYFLWSAIRAPVSPWSTRLFLGLLLTGGGVFNLVEGVIDHHILKIHHVRQNSDHQTAWDLGFLAVNAVIAAAGLALVRRGSAELDVPSPGVRSD
jgi:uncharacterized membrane protein